MKERHQRLTHRSTQISPQISAQPMIPESARAEFWPTTSPRRVGLASCARRGPEGSFLCSLRHPNLAATPWGGSPPRPLCQKICYSDCTENCPLCPLRAPQEVSESENRPATRGTAHSEVQGDDRGTARCTTRCSARCSARPMAALHFLLPTGDSR